MRFLIIDADYENAELLKRLLEEACFAVDHVSDGKKGSFMARTNDYDLIILDYNLPSRNGVDICSEIRRAGRTIPIVGLLSAGAIEHEVAFLETGADDCILKPFTCRRLMARIRALLRRAPSLRTQVHSVADVIVDTGSQKAHRGKRRIPLSPKEFAFLELLLLHRGNVVSRSLIFEHVWDAEADPFSRTIESHVFNLRKKLGSKARKLIQNVPGRGYMIEG
jgi:DNA-binding response OmpR family regulator